MDAGFEQEVGAAGLRDGLGLELFSRRVVNDEQRVSLHIGHGVHRVLDGGDLPRPV